MKERLSSEDAKLKYPVHVRNVIGEMSSGGIEVLVMNIYRNVDRNKV